MFIFIFASKPLGCFTYYILNRIKGVIITFFFDNDNIIFLLLRVWTQMCLHPIHLCINFIFMHQINASKFMQQVFYTSNPNDYVSHFANNIRMKFTYITSLIFRPISMTWFHLDLDNTVLSRWHINFRVLRGSKRGKYPQHIQSL